jgi:DNA-binding NtrC family response regulator
MPARILIVEDEQITAEDLRDILTDLGYTVTDVVSNGAAAIDRAEKNPPDMALMDIRIKGDMDGTETARILREQFNIPVVYLTAHADRATLERAKVAEPLGYITKPFKQLELQASIEIALHKHREDVKAKEREQVLSATLRALGMGVLSVDREEAVTLLNATAEAWTGWPSKEAARKPVGEVFPLIDERTGERIESSVAEVLAAGKLEELRPGVLLLGRNGTKRPIEGSIAPIWDHHGEVTGAVVVFGDRNGGKVAGHGAAPEQEEDGLGFGGFKMIAASAAMKQVVKFARRVAESEASTILLEGESGTGKDVMAHFMHHFGKRQDRPFVPLNCAAIPETLLESELFGYEKGAFTDARSPKPGILEIASGGTVFLDEIGEMPILVQAKMLRVLEEQTFRRLGGVRDIHVDLRVLAASNRHLADAVDQGKFRLDLYYRLNVIQIMLPPLRERKEDVLPLAKYFIQHYNTRFKRNIMGISSAATTAMLSYDWPGNVRELRNTIERAVLLEETDWVQPVSLRLEGSPMDYSSPVQKSQPEDAKAAGTLEETERRMLMEALDKTGWNQTRAAMLLGISRDTLRYKVKKYNLPRPSGVSDAATD